MIIYQLRTCNELASFKGLFLKKDQLRKKIDEVVRSTEKFRQNIEEEVLKECGWKRSVNKREMIESIEINEIDTFIFPQYLNCFGSSRDINVSSLISHLLNKSKLFRDKNAKEADGKTNGET